MKNGVQIRILWQGVDQLSVARDLIFFVFPKFVIMFVAMSIFYKTQLMQQPIYLDYNATTPIDAEVASAMQPFIEIQFGNPSSGYCLGQETKAAVEQARQQVANLLGCSGEEVMFTSGGTESNNLAIKGFARANRCKGNHIITSAVEHPAVTEVCRSLECEGFEITTLPVDATGAVLPTDVEKAIRPETILITIMHANNEVGTIQPIDAIGAIAKRYHIALHTDASQSVGKISTDVSALGVHLLTVAGHKLYAPKGIGALYIKNGIHLQQLMHGAGQEQGIRPGTENVIQIVGLGAACAIAQRDLKARTQQMETLRNRLYYGLNARLGQRLRVNGDLTKALPNTLSVSIDGISAHTLAETLGNEVMLSTGSACHSGVTSISPVLKAMHIPMTIASGTLRLSVGKQTTEAEVERAIAAIVLTVEKLSD